MLNVEKTNLFKKTRFLESKHHSLIENNNALTQEIKNIWEPWITSFPCPGSCRVHASILRHL